MFIEIGHFCVVLALVLSVLAMVSPIVGLKTARPELVRVARQAVTLNFFLVSIGMAALIYSFLTNDYSVKYVMETSNSKLPVFYKVAGLWGGHEGSLMLWVWILTAYSTLVVWLHWRTQPVVMPYLLSIQSLIMFGFLAMIVFLSNPFERLYPVPPDGRDLNPLLQDPAMVVHPPMLYLGYVGFSIPFAFAMSALFSGRLGEEWIKVTQRWTLFAWISLTTGILMGGYWAYYELGWGGYWGWDPVENASFMPWLVGTAFLHSVMVQEKRKMFKVWNLFLIIVTFSLSLIGTFLVRSGVLSSVHTFATDPGRGLYILVFLALMLALGFGTLIVRSGKLRSQIEMDSIVSKESVFLFNNLFFLVAAATVFLGTLYPLLVETLKTAKVSVGPPYYNAVFMPVALGLLLMMGIGPTIAWRKASLDNLKRNFMPAALLAVAAAVLAWLIGIRTVFGMAGALVVTFVATTIFVDFGKVSALWARRHETNYLIGFYRGFTNNQRRSAGLVTHLGVLIMVVGIIASTVYQVEKVVSMRIGDVIQLENYSIKMVGLHEVSGANWTAQEGLFEVSKGDRLLSVLKPQKRLYPVSETPTTEAALYTIHLGHIFLTMPEVASDNSVTVRALINPLVLLVWIGGGIMGLGVVLNIFRPRTKASA
ncbi:MAG TPA: heme lyase CcmF/NrfE family subunit [Nitrospiria bacterium]|jgi:cytochrome c-type biogenesis protein CcmF|nr:heme lyase CcmF/NrfE family subunit [Nitrospiria bacterium]